MGKDQDNIVPIGTTQGYQKPKSFIDALSQIQQFYVIEHQAGPLPADFFTLKEKIEFTGVGFKSVIASALVSIFFTPVFIGVIEKHIPIFGSYDPSLADKVFAFILTAVFTLGYSLFLATKTPRYYIPNICRSAINLLLSGMVVAALLKMVIALVLYHTLWAIPDETLASWLLHLKGHVSLEKINVTYLWMVNFKPALLKSSLLVMLMTVLMILIPLVSIAYCAIKVRREKKRKAKWDV
jgi:hypothetical protein